MNYDIVTFGVPIMEIMRKNLDCPIDRIGDFEGPYPAGDPGICLNECVAMGYRGCYVGVVGDDDLGAGFLKKMDKNGIDRSRIRVDRKHTTALSLLAKFSDGSRRFVFTLPTSAAARLGPEDFDRELLHSVRWIHISGFALSVSPSIAQLHGMILDEIGDEVMVSFDPNYRKEVLDLESYRNRCQRIYERCNLFLPSEGEAVIFEPDAADDREACKRAAGKGKMAALKLGARGAWGFQGDRQVYEPGFPAKEVDPTGAGDTFSGALIASLMDGRDFFSSMVYGCAAGSLCVQRKGLMESAPVRFEVEELVRTKRQDGTGGHDE